MNDRNRRYKQQINPRFLPGGDIHEASKGKGPDDQLFPDPSTRQYVQLHDHEMVTVEKILMRKEPWFIIVHAGTLAENEFRHTFLVTEAEGLAIAEAFQKAEVNPTPIGS